MLENLRNFFKKMGKKEDDELLPSSSDAAKERLHLVLMQDRVNVSVDFMDMMKQELLDVVKKYIDIDEKEMDVRLTNQINEDGSNGAPALYANIPIVGIKPEKAVFTVGNESSSQVTGIENKKEIKQENVMNPKKISPASKQASGEKKTTIKVNTKKMDKIENPEENNTKNTTKQAVKTTTKKENISEK